MVIERHRAHLALQEVADAPKKMGPDALLKDKFKTSRQRSGYEDGVSLAHRPAPAAGFILSENPVEMLARFTRCVQFCLAASLPVSGADCQPSFVRRTCKTHRSLQSAGLCTRDAVATECLGKPILRTLFETEWKWRHRCWRAAGHIPRRP